MELKIGVVGYSSSPFDEEKAREYLQHAFDALQREYPGRIYIVVSGLTNLGVPKIAYDEATKRNWKTVGISCSKAYTMECFNVDKRLIVGDDWGDESESFIEQIDVLVRIGGGPQSFNEVTMMRRMNKPIKEYEVALLERSRISWTTLWATTWSLRIGFPLILGVIFILVRAKGKQKW